MDWVLVGARLQGGLTLPPAGAADQRRRAHGLPTPGAAKGDGPALGRRLCGNRRFAFDLREREQFSLKKKGGVGAH